MGEWWVIPDIKFCDRLGDCVFEGCWWINVLLLFIRGVFSTDVSCVNIKKVYFLPDIQ